MILALALALLAYLVGVPLASQGATAVACVALLLFGLPHGTLDLELIRARLSGPWTGMATLVALYLAFAAGMYAVWQVQPVLALAAFIAIAVAHFAEDWNDGQPLLRAAPALALLAAPTLFHGAELDAIFIGLTNRTDAGIVGSGLAVLAPVAIGLAAWTMGRLWLRGERDQAIGALAALAGMTILPPIVGFAAYFCFFHSPRHFRHSLADLDWRGVRKWGWVVLPLTLAAGLLAAILFGLQVRTEISDRIMAASFMTLSILTVPHMLVPLLINRLVRRRPHKGPSDVRELVGVDLFNHGAGPAHAESCPNLRSRTIRFRG